MKKTFNELAHELLQKFEEVNEIGSEIVKKATDDIDLDELVEGGTVKADRTQILGIIVSENFAMVNNHYEVLVDTLDTLIDIEKDSDDE